MRNREKQRILKKMAKCRYMGMQDCDLTTSVFKNGIIDSTANQAINNIIYQSRCVQRKYKERAITK